MSIGTPLLPPMYGSMCPDAPKNGCSFVDTPDPLRMYAGGEDRAREAIICLLGSIRAYGLSLLLSSQKVNRAAISRVEHVFRVHACFQQNSLRTPPLRRQKIQRLFSLWTCQTEAALFVTVDIPCCVG